MNDGVLPLAAGQAARPEQKKTPARAGVEIEMSIDN